MSYLFSKNSPFYKNLNPITKAELSGGKMQHCSEYDVEEDMNRIWEGTMGTAWRESYQSLEFSRRGVQYSVYDEPLPSLDKENNKFMGIDAASQGLDFDEQLAENERMRDVYTKGNLVINSSQDINKE